MITQWKIVGNSEVHGVGNLTSWKVSGNSVVDNNAILSCGDLGQDGKYHVKISNGVTIYDIPLTKPLRKVNNVADTIKFPTITEGKVLVTRNLGIVDWSNVRVVKGSSPVTYFVLYDSGIKIATNNILSAIYPSYTYNTSPVNFGGLGVASHGTGATIRIVNEDMNDLTAEQFKAANADVEIIYELATPTTELVDVSPFPVSPTDTYTSANVVPYSAFERTENKEIWSCGEYNATDGKWHILVQPQGGSIADIALTEPLRKVNDVADTIEFPSETEGKTLVTRNLYSAVINTCEVSTVSSGRICAIKLTGFPARIRYVDTGTAPLLCNKMETLPYATCVNYEGIACCLYGTSIYIRNSNIEQTQQAYQDYFDNELGSVNFIYQLATPTTELVDAPQIEEADSYTCVISQGAKAVEWSSFITK